MTLPRRSGRRSAGNGKSFLQRGRGQGESEGSCSRARRLTANRSAALTARLQLRLGANRSAALMARLQSGSFYDRAIGSVTQEGLLWFSSVDQSVLIVPLIVRFKRSSVSTVGRYSAL